MDADVLRWILDFLVRSSIPNALLKKIIAAIPFPDIDSSLQKAFLLRIIQDELSKASISETLLEILEMIEEIDRNNGMTIMDSMRAAYCAVAVESTVKYFAVCPENNEGCVKVVKRIWRRRMSYMEGSEERSELIGEVFKQWRNEIEAAVRDLEARVRLGNVNTHKDASNKLGGYLKEAWVTVGPGFLELIGRLMKVKNLEYRAVEGDVAMRSKANLDEESRGNVAGRTTNTREMDRYNVGGNVVVVDGGARVRLDQGCSAEIGIGFNNVTVNTVDAEGSGDNLTGQQVEERVVDKTKGLSVSDLPANEVAEIQNFNLLHKKKQNAYPKHRKRIKKSIPDEEEENEDAVLSFNNHDLLPSSEVIKIQEALISSSLELQALVKDPLPDALCMSEFARSELEKRKIIENPTICSQRNIPRASLMERNNTAHAYEWDDSITESPKGSSNYSSRSHEPSSNKNKVSPLKKYAFEKITKRRKIKKWTLIEEDTLREGVRKFGAGNWKLILNSYRDIFEERTEVDLKDKWRNMTRYNTMVRYDRQLHCRAIFMFVGRLKYQPLKDGGLWTCTFWLHSGTSVCEPDA